MKTPKLLKVLALVSFVLAFVLPWFKVNSPTNLIALGLAFWVLAEVI
jgi:hypothetical protein